MITSEVQRYGISYGISVLGIAEHRCVGQRHFEHTAGGTIKYSDGEKGGLYGVAIYLDSETEETLSCYNPVNERIKFPLG